MIGHIVITLPYTILVLVPRLEQIDASLEEAAYDLGANRLRTFRLITLPLILPAVVSAFLIAFTTSFDEYAVASFVVGHAHDVSDLPLLGAALPEPAAAGDRGRGGRAGRLAPSWSRRRSGGASSSAVRCHLEERRRPREYQESVTGEPGFEPGGSLVREAVATTAPARVSTWNCVYIPR